MQSWLLTSSSHPPLPSVCYLIQLHQCVTLTDMHSAHVTCALCTGGPSIFITVCDWIPVVWWFRWGGTAWRKHGRKMSMFSGVTLLGASSPRCIYISYFISSFSKKGVMGYLCCTLMPLGPWGPLGADKMDPSAAMVTPGSPFSPC